MSFDLSSPAQLSAALGPDLLLMGGAMILLLWSGWRPESNEHQRSVGIFSIALCVLTMVAVAYYAYRGWPANGGPIAVDNFRWAADEIFLIATIGTITTFTAISRNISASQRRRRIMRPLTGTISRARRIETRLCHGAGLELSDRSLICLPSTFEKDDGLQSRIVPSFGPGTVITTPRHQVDVIVTEYGVAELEGKTVQGRGEALAAIAHPQFRDELLAAAERASKGRSPVA